MDGIATHGDNQNHGEANIQEGTKRRCISTMPPYPFVMTWMFSCVKEDAIPRSPINYINPNV